MYYEKKDFSEGEEEKKVSEVKEAAKSKENTPTIDEVEDLYQLLSKVKEEYPEVNAVASGAIFSNY